MTSREKSSRHHHRKRLLIYRPSPNDFLKTPPQPPAGAQHDTSSPRGFLSALHQASPMERERRRVLSVQLRDISQEVEHLQVQMSPCERTSGSNDWSMCNKLSSTIVHQDLGITQAAAVLPITTEEPSHTFPAGHPALMPPPLLPPKEESGWGLVPLFNSVRSKLESFAEIFLTPVKSQRVAQNSEDGTHPGEMNYECSVVGDMSRGTVQPFTLSPGLRAIYSEERGLSAVHSSAVLHGDGTTEDNPSPSQLQTRPPDPRLQTETCQSPSVLCRPPLQRYLSCPLLPLTQHKWRHSFGTTEYTAAEPCTYRRRRHSLGSVEECQNPSLMPFSLSCLRKENHPSVLKQSPYPAGDVRKSPNGSIHTEGSPASLCLDRDREQGLGVEDQVTMESLPVSDFKTPENLCHSKENKVSNIQIRKRALRQEGKLTPLGLPKRVRLQKEDFSLEEIYTNKNYHTPTEKRKFETIFEEPVMKGGTLIFTSQRPLRRIMVFRDGGSAPRKRKKKGKVVNRTRRCAATSTEENVNYELLLQHKLNQLDAALQEDTAEL